MKYRTNETELEIESDSPLNEEILSGIMNILDKVQSPRSFSPETKAETVLVKADTPPAPTEDDSVSLRGRLPNTFKKGATVDMAEMEIGSSKATAHHNFRCPSCLQSSVTVVDNNVLIRDIEVEEGGVYLTVGVDLEDFDYKAAATQAVERVTLVADGLSEAHCPLCSEDALVEKWVDAYHNPLTYSEFEHPCPVCGGETVTTISQEGGRQMECEKTGCGYTKKLEE